MVKLKVILGFILVLISLFSANETSAYWACGGSGSATRIDYYCESKIPQCPYYRPILCRSVSSNYTSWCSYVTGHGCARINLVRSRTCSPAGACFSSTDSCWASGDSAYTWYTTSGCFEYWVPDPTPTPDPSCTVTAPTGLSVTRISPTSATLAWTPGANGTEQRVYIGANLTEVESNCPGTGSPLCVVSQTGLPTSQASYTTGNVLSAGTVYYYRVLNYKDATCSIPSATSTSISSCDLTPDSLSLQVGSSGTLITSANSSSEIQSVNYTSANTGVATVNPASDSTAIYQTSVTGVSVNSTTVRSDVMIGGSVNCTDTSNITVTPPGSWWQVKDADVTSNGDLISLIPGSCILPACNPVFGLKGTGGFPGVPAYGGATADFQAGAGTGRAAEDPYNWLAASRYLGRTYDYAFFERQIPDDVVINELTPPVTGGTFNSGGTPSRGYVWYHWNGATLGDLTINGNVNLVGSRKVVLLVEGANTIINGRIQLQSPGQGFFMMVVGKDGNGLKGDILVDPSVINIEGIFLAESEFKTGVASSQLNVRGSVVAYEGVSLERDLGVSNANTPAEVFTYAPDIIATFPKVFTQRRLRWKEVAP